MIKNGVTKYQCLNCDKSYLSYSGAQVHFIASHTTRFQCKIDNCNKCFGSSYTLKVHKRKHTIINIKDKAFKCKLCKKSFDEKKSLTRHIRIHKHEKPFKCEYCGKRFTRFDTCDRHETIHMYD